MKSDTLSIPIAEIRRITRKGIDMAYVIDTSHRTRRRALRAATPLAALLVAALLVWQGSSAAFSATTDNTANAWATGSLTLTNNGGGTTYAGSTTGVFAETNLKPGDAGAKCITVESTGSLPGDMRFYRGVVTGTNSAALAAEIGVTVDALAIGSATNVQADCAGYTGGTSGAVYNGSLDAMATTYTGAAATSVALSGGTERVVYRIGWTIDAAADNSVQSSSAQADLVWEVN
jgi:hypothetical protein